MGASHDLVKCSVAITLMCNEFAQTISCYGSSVICHEHFLYARTSVQMLLVWFQSPGLLGRFMGLARERLPSESSSDFAVRQTPGKLQFLAGTLLQFPGSLQQGKHFDIFTAGGRSISIFNHFSIYFMQLMPHFGITSQVLCTLLIQTKDTMLRVTNLRSKWRKKI